MGQDQITQLLQQGIAAARSNRPDIARGIFQQVVTMDPRNETAWAWLASIARNNKERLIFLKRLWEINPQNDFALKGLHALGIDPNSEQQQAAAPQSTVPLLDDARFARTQQAVDEFLRRYTAEPIDQLQISWEHRQRQRYGEAGAQRLRRTVYAAASLVVLLFVSVIVFVLTQVNFLGAGGGRAISTWVPTQTLIASLTPTLGGPTPTEFSELAFEPTSIPAGLDAGSVMVISSPTPIRPAPNPSINRSLENALAYYAIGDYTTASDMLVTLHEDNEPQCYPSVVYFEALSYAQLGEFARAETLLLWGQTYEPPNRLNSSCQDSPLMPAGLADVSYWQNDYAQALELSVQALDMDDELVPAILTKGRSELALGQSTEAWQTVSRGLDEFPEDTNLLLLAADIELANSEPNAALDHIGQALFIDPDLQIALYRQAEAYLMLGEQSTETERKLQAYGLAVRSAQLLLLYYEGDPLGYLYLAKARIGEGNAEMAETALTRVVDVEDSLPDSAAPVVEEIYRIRGELYFDQGRFTEAMADLEHYVNLTDTFDAPAVEMIVHSASSLGNARKLRQWVEVLLNDEPDNSEYQLLQVKLWVEQCALYPNDLTCQYDDALEMLDDTFFETLTLDTQRADAYSYRAQARYGALDRERAVLSENDITAALQAAFDDTTQALAIRESVLDHYYRGLLFEELDNAERAYEEYQWVNYWDALYAYPFVDSDFETHFATVASAVEEAKADRVVTVEAPTSRPPTDTGTGDETPEPAATSEAEDADATEEAAPEATPTATTKSPTVPPDDIP